ncbi:MAG: hypothetical protein AAF647_12670 [Pseudomonadota bacterium]
MASISFEGSDASRRVNWAVIGPWALFCGALALAAQVIYPNEDAAILFRYAVNLSQTGVISYNPGGAPAEGATDFLFMVAIAALNWLGLTPILAAHALNAAAFLVILALLNRVSPLDLFTGIGVTAAFVAMAPFAAAVAGFSVFVFSAAILAACAFALERNVLPFSMAALACCLIRPDGFVFAAPLTLFMIWQLRRAPRGYLTLLGALVLPGIAYFLWRWWYFGDFLPLPFYVKAEVTRNILGLFYSGSIADLLRMAGPLFVGMMASLVAARRGRLPAGRFLPVLATVALPALAFYMSMHLIQNLGNRFLAFIPLLAVFAVTLIAERWLRLAFLAALTMVLIPGAGKDFRYLSQDSNDHYIARAIGGLDNDITMAVTEAGHLALGSGAHVTDLWGLNTRDFARLPATGADVEGQAYDLIVMHYPGTYSCQAMRARHAALYASGVRQRDEIARRDWTLMVEGVLTGLNPNAYALYRVPAFRPSDGRYFMYLIAEDRPNAQALARIVTGNNGVPCPEL